MKRSAVVFAYHNVGVRCLSVLLAQGVDVKLVVTHQDNEQEMVWFDSVQQLARDEGIPVITPASPNDAEIIRYIHSLQPDFVFSFYYRHMLSSALLKIAKYGCYNMHGSLLPHYRGRAPVNWAVLHNEKESGATLHVMTEKPDQGAIVGQKAVPILPNDTAAEVMQKVTVAAELCLYEVIGPLLQGTILHRAQILTQGSYFSGRQREDGRINWQLSAQKIHHLVRAVAPPYPGAFFDYHLQQITILRTRVLDRIDRNKAGKMMCEEGNIYAASYDGSLLRILAAQIEDKPLSAKNWEDFFSTACITL